MVETTLRAIDPNVPYRAVHASRGKITRAEPVSALYEQGRVRHVGGFPRLEDQMCSWTPPKTAGRIGDGWIHSVESGSEWRHGEGNARIF